MSFFKSSRIRIVEFNVENLFVLIDQGTMRSFSDLNEREWKKLSASTTPNKPIEQIRQIARSISEMDPDIVLLCEIGGLESLRNFSIHFLGDTYAPYLLEGNSDRGIDIGYLVKRRLPFTYDLISHKHRSIEFLYPHERLTKETGYEHLRSARIKSHRFSRDVLELRIFESTQKNPVLVILLVHLKSQLDRNRIDPGGRDRRKAELEKLVKIYAEIDADLGGETPILLAGDLNGVAARPQPDPEFNALYTQTLLEDCLEVAGVSTDNRFTYQQLYTNRPGQNRQLDYIFIPPALAKRVDPSETYVYRFRDDLGMTRLVPRNLNEKRSLPSDHFPVILTLLPE